MQEVVKITFEDVNTKDKLSWRAVFIDNGDSIELELYKGAVVTKEKSLMMLLSDTFLDTFLDAGEPIIKDK